MTSLLNFSLKSVFLLIILSFTLLFATTIFAQTPEETAAKYGVTFPVSELGGCTDLSQCRTYCEDPINHDKCIQFAKEKGFYQQDPLYKDMKSILTAASSELGCNSYDSCMTFCQSPANFDKCSDFAKKHNLGGGHVDDPTEEQFLKKAKDLLGCDSPTSCLTLCENEANWQKCSDFAKAMGFAGGQTHAGPGGCTTPQTCEAYCSNPNNFQDCSQFSDSSEFKGPGGCTDEASCRAYCEKNQLKCASEGPVAQFCLNNPQKCQEGISLASFCQENVSVCPKTDSSDYCRTNPSLCPPEGGNIDKWCQENPQKCTYTSSPSEDINPDEYCKQYPDRCTQNQTQTQTQSSPPPTSEPQQNTNSQPNQQPTYDPSNECQKAGGSWTGSTCEFKQVQGANTQESFLLKIVRSFLSLF